MGDLHPKESTRCELLIFGHSLGLPPLSFVSIYYHFGTLQERFQKAERFRNRIEAGQQLVWNGTGMGSERLRNDFGFEYEAMSCRLRVALWINAERKTS